MPRPVAQSHDGVTIVVPVDDEVAAAEDAHQPRHCNPRQPRRILGKRRNASHERVKLNLPEAKKQDLPYRKYWILAKQIQIY